MAQQALKSEVTGTVWKVECAVGDRVEAEQVLLIIESMKMEIPLEAPVAGVVVGIPVAEGQPVEEGETLCLIET